MIYPSPIQKGDTIRICAPSGAVDGMVVENAVANLTRWGYNVIVGHSALNKWGRFAGTDEERITDLQEAINDPLTKVILCARGGYGLARIIDRIDLTPLLKKPKWVVGFSDITVLHSAMSAAGLTSLHAGMCRQISDEGSASTIKLMDTLLGWMPSYYGESTSQYNRQGCSKGKLIGGNLSVLHGLIGTPYDLSYRNNILLLEDVCEPLYRIDRMIESLRLAGVFRKISGLIVGQFNDMSEDDSFDGGAYGIINAALGNEDIPVCYNFKSGHTDVNMPLIIGATTTMEVTDNSIIVTQSL